jgi:hypothetical protein
MPHLRRPVYESLPGAYALAGALLLWVSYRYREVWWSTPCALAGLAGLIVGLVIWMRRRDYRATSADYRRRGRPVGDLEDPRP